MDGEKIEPPLCWYTGAVKTICAGIIDDDDQPANDQPDPATIPPAPGAAMEATQHA